MSKSRIWLGTGGGGLAGLGFVIDHILPEPEPWVLWAIGIASAALILVAVFGPAIARLLRGLMKGDAGGPAQISAGGHITAANRVTAGRDVNLNVGGSIQESGASPKKVSRQVFEEFMALHSDGKKLLTRDKSLAPGAWRQEIILWFGSAEKLVSKHYSTSESFMFNSVSKIPETDEKFDDCPKLLQQRLNKLRLMIGRLSSD